MATTNTPSYLIFQGIFHFIDRGDLKFKSPVRVCVWIWIYFQLKPFTLIIPFITINDDDSMRFHVEFWSESLWEIIIIQLGLGIIIKSATFDPCARFRLLRVFHSSQRNNGYYLVIRISKVYSFRWIDRGRAEQDESLSLLIILTFFGPKVSPQSAFYIDVLIYSTSLLPFSHSYSWYGQRSETLETRRPNAVQSITNHLLWTVQINRCTERIEISPTSWKIHATLLISAAYSRN